MPAAGCRARDPLRPGPPGRRSRTAPTSSPCPAPDAAGTDEARFRPVRLGRSHRSLVPSTHSSYGAGMPRYRLVAGDSSARTKDDAGLRIGLPVKLLLQPHLRSPPDDLLDRRDDV